MDKDLKNYNWFWIVPTVTLFLAPFPWPYAYYRLLRLIICGSSLFLGFNESRKKWKVPLFILATLYNPLILFSFEKETWTVINIFTALFFILHFLFSRSSLRPKLRDIISKM